MKKLYKETKWKKYSHKRSLAVLKLKRKKQKKYIYSKKHGKAIICGSRYLLKKRKTKDKRTITAPSMFCLVENYEQVVEFLDKIDNMIQDCNICYLDLSSLIRITPDALLYLISWFDIKKDLLRQSKVYSIDPEESVCREMLYAAGFYSRISIEKISQKFDIAILSLQTGELVEPVIANKVVEFAKKHLCSGDICKNSKAMYSILIECMANTKNHAYRLTRKDVKNWWLMANREEKSYTERVHFAFLDRGDGIPVTIRKNILERGKQKMKLMSDSDLLLSTLKGEFRTRTKKGFRGKGLPKIHEHSNAKEIKNLLIISQNGYYHFKNDFNHNEVIVKDIPNKFHGTLISWDFA